MNSHYDYLYEEFCWDQGYSPFDDYGFYPFLEYMREEEPGIEEDEDFQEWVRVTFGEEFEI